MFPQQQQNMPPEQFLVFALCVGLIAGLLCGLVPLIVGLTRGYHGLAWGGFAACAFSGAILGLILAVPMSIIFTIIIACKSPANQQRPRYHPEYDDYDDRRTARRFRGEYDEDYDDRRPINRRGEIDRRDRDNRDDWPQPKQDPPKEERRGGFGFREVND